MRNKFRLGAVVALLLAVPITVASASSSSGNSGDRGKRSVEVIRVTEIIVQEAAIDLGEPGDSLGDQFVSSSDLFRAGEKVGIDGVVCTIVRLVPMVSATAQCVGTAELPRGQITIQGLLTFTDGPSTFQLAITGGTRKYREAHGEVTVEEISETESRITFRIIR